MKNQLIIQGLQVATTEGKKILNGVNLKINQGEVHALMGPNGSGKSTLASSLMGHPGFIITGGKITLNGLDITKSSPDKRAKIGLFLGFQYPLEISGVNLASFLRMAVKEKSSKRISPIAFQNLF